MKKIYFLLLAVFSIASISYAQQKKSSFEEIKDGEYTIRLLSSPGNTYGFDILKDQLVIVHQQFSPFPGSKKMQGLQKEDVIKISKYLLQQTRKTNKPPAPILPDEVAKELNIKL